MCSEINVVRRTAGVLAVGVALLFGIGMTKQVLGDYPTYYAWQKGAKQARDIVKTQQKTERRALGIHQRGEREALKSHQRVEREAFRPARTPKLLKPRHNYRHSAHKGCIKDCNLSHKRATRACHGRTGADRRACERAANEEHRRCHAGCPK